MIVQIESENWLMSVYFFFFLAISLCTFPPPPSLPPRFGNVIYLFIMIGVKEGCARVLIGSPFLLFARAYVCVRVG